jgi:hypothetical protein
LIGNPVFAQAFKNIDDKPKLTTRDIKTLQEKTFYGKKKKSLAYVRCVAKARRENAHDNWGRAGRIQFWNLRRRGHISTSAVSCQIATVII